MQERDWERGRGRWEREERKERGGRGGLREWGDTHLSLRQQGGLRRWKLPESYKAIRRDRESYLVVSRHMMEVAVQHRSWYLRKIIIFGRS